MVITENAFSCLFSNNQSCQYLIGWTKKRPPVVAAQIGLHLLAHAVKQSEALSGEAARHFSADARAVCLREARAVLATECRGSCQGTG